MKQQVMIIHGGEVFKEYKDFLGWLKRLEIDPYKKPFKDWKSTLQEKLGTKYEVIYPSFPNKLNAQYEEWKIWFDKYIPFLRHGVILVGHSLGGTFLAKYLSENKFPVIIKKIHFVATPVEGCNRFDPMGGAKLQCTITDNVYIYHSDDDEVVPMKVALGIPTTTFRRFKKRGHFLQKNFPEIVKDIKSK